MKTENKSPLTTKEFIERLKAELIAVKDQPLIGKIIAAGLVLAFLSVLSAIIFLMLLY